MATQNIKTKLVLCNLVATVAGCDQRVPMDNITACKHSIPKMATADCPYKIPFDLNLTLTIPEGPKPENESAGTQPQV
jgi:hypothetical protein